MRNVQASHARAQLLKLLDQVEAGESLTISRRGRIVAQLVPAKPEPPKPPKKGAAPQAPRPERRGNPRRRQCRARADGLKPATIPSRDFGPRRRHTGRA